MEVSAVLLRRGQPASTVTLHPLPYLSSRIRDVSNLRLHPTSFPYQDTYGIWLPFFLQGVKM